MYFCGWTTEQILEKKLPLELMKRGVNVSFIFAMYAMLELKGNNSAMLVYGCIKDSGPCAWVEYNNGNGKRMVRDYCTDWIELSYLNFHNTYHPDTERIYLDYIFWTKYTEKLYKLAQVAETSYILNDLVAMSPKFENGKVYGITDFSCFDSLVTNGKNTNPTMIVNPDNSLIYLKQEFLKFLMQ